MKNRDVVVLACKPNMVRKILRDVYPVVTKDHLIISIAAGVSLDTLQQVGLRTQSQAQCVKYNHHPLCPSYIETSLKLVMHFKVWYVGLPT